LSAKIVAGDWLLILREQSSTIATLAQLDRQRLLILENTAEKTESDIVLVVGAIEIYLPIADLMDLNDERARMEKGLFETEVQIERLEALLASPFSEKAPLAVVQKELDKLETFKETAEKLRQQLRLLG
jgi:valyl-tRNA synthetase